MNNCNWAITSYCGTNPAFRQCVPKWICSCAGDTDCYNCERFCWASCPAWSEWAPIESPFFWSVSTVFRLRQCPCERAVTEPLDSQLFQSDRISGHCIQARLSLGTGAVSWDSLLFCLLVMLLVIAYLLKECLFELEGRRKVTEEGYDTEGINGK